MVRCHEKKGVAFLCDGCGEFVITRECGCIVIGDGVVFKEVESYESALPIFKEYWCVFFDGLGDIQLADKTAPRCGICGVAAEVK